MSSTMVFFLCASLSKPADVINYRFLILCAIISKVDDTINSDTYFTVCTVISRPDNLINSDFLVVFITLLSHYYIPKPHDVRNCRLFIVCTAITDSVINIDFLLVCVARRCHKHRFFKLYVLLCRSSCHKQRYIFSLRAPFYGSQMLSETVIYFKITLRVQFYGSQMLS